MPRSIYALVTVLTLFRLIAAARVGLGDAEAYYWTWSQQLASSYYDHGPLVAWSIRMGTTLLGDTTLGVRLVFILYGALLILVVAALTQRIYGTKQAFFAVATLLTMPMVLVAGGAANPDVPFVLLVALFAHTSTSRHTAPDFWLLARAGILAGLATSTKLFGLALIVPLFWLLWHKYPRSLRAFFTAMAALLFGMLPLLIWNLQHDWASLRYHLVARHADSSIGFSLVNLAKLLGGQLGYAGPLTCVALLMAAALAWRLSRERRELAQLLATSLPLLASGMLLILIVPSAEPHWPAAGYIPLLPLLAFFTVESWQRKWVRVCSVVALVVGAIVFALFHLHVMTDLGVRLAPKDYVARYDISNELYGWPQVGDAVQRELATHGGPRKAVAAACHYTSCAQLRFAARGRYEVGCPSPRVSQFDFFPGGDGSSRRGIDLLYLRDERFPFAASTLYRCAEVRRARSVKITRAGRLVRRFELHWCVNFQGLRATRWPPPERAESP